MKINYLFKDKDFYKKLLKLALPITFQNLILSSLNLIDTIVIGGLGDQAIASVGLANQFYFLLNLVLFGITSGSSIFTAQYWGSKDIKNIRRVLGICIFSGVFFSTIFTLGGLFFPNQILSIFSKDAQVVMGGSEYLRVASLSYIFTSITFTFSFLLRSIGQVKLPMFVSTTALGINTVLNYVFVYGYLGVTPMGVKGAAVATLIARSAEVILIVSLVYKKNLPLAAKLSELLDIPKDFMKKFFKVTIPVILNEVIWSLGVTLYSVAYARMGTQVIASINISNTVSRIIWVIFIGIGSSCAVMIGNRLGEGDSEQVYDYAKRFLILGPLLAIVMSIILISSSGVILSVYKVSPVVKEYAIKNLMVFSTFLWARAMNFIIIIGILRSGGDTKYCLFLDVGGVWLVGVPFAFLGGLVWNLPVYWVYFLVSFEEVFKLIFGIPRVISKKWINNIT